MLGEKRNLSLFASQPAQEDKQVKHITVDRDGEKKGIFRCTSARTGLSSTALVILFLLPVMTRPPAKQRPLRKKQKKRFLSSLYRRIQPPV